MSAIQTLPVPVQALSLGTSRIGTLSARPSFGLLVWNQAMNKPTFKHSNVTRKCTTVFCKSKSSASSNQKRQVSTKSSIDDLLARLSWGPNKEISSPNRAAPDMSQVKSRQHDDPTGRNNIIPFEKSVLQYQPKLPSDAEDFDWDTHPGLKVLDTARIVEKEILEKTAIELDQKHEHFNYKNFKKTRQSFCPDKMSELMREADELHAMNYMAVTESFSEAVSEISEDDIEDVFDDTEYPKAPKSVPEFPMLQPEEKIAPWRFSATLLRSVSKHRLARHPQVSPSLNSHRPQSSIPKLSWHATASLRQNQHYNTPKVEELSSSAFPRLGHGHPRLWSPGPSESGVVERKETRERSVSLFQSPRHFQPPRQDDAVFFNSLERNFLNMFPVWTAFSSLVALRSPSAFSFMTTDSFTLGLATVMFSLGMTMTVEDFKDAIAKPGPVAMNFATCFLMMPCLAYTLAKLFGLSAMMTAGCVLVGAINGGWASDLCTFIAKGNVALSVVMTTVTTLATCVVTPLVLKMCLGTVISMDMVGVIKSTIQVILAPMLAGVMASRFVPKLCRNFEAACPVVGVLVTVLLVGTSVAQCARPILDAGLTLQVAVLALHLIGGVASYCISRLAKYDESTSRTMAIETSMKCSAFGFLIASLHFPDYMVRVPSAVSVMWMAIVGSTLAVVWRSIPIKKTRSDSRLTYRFD